MLHKVFAVAGVLIVAAVIYGGVKADRMVRIGAGYKAKIACSEIFLAGRDATTIVRHEFDGMDPAMDQIVLSVDEEAKRVRARGPFGLGAVRAVYREGYGCTLANMGRVAPLPAPPATILASEWETAPPVSGRALPQVDYAALDAALTRVFDENDADHRAVLVAVDGRIVDERYADGFGPSTPFLSWSMAKSVMATLVGAAVLDGLIDIDDPAPVPEWAGDAQKSQITWNDLLQMQSGLDFIEEYDKVRSDVNRMLFEQADAGVVAARMPLGHPPGEYWYYSSGTTNLLARTLRQVLEREGVDFHAFAHDRLFAPLGAASVVMEPDPSGTFIGSSFVYATARDWAKLGQLYLQNGVFDGVRLLPEGWSDYVATPAAAADGQYGAQFWLNNAGAGERPPFFEGVPEDMYFFAGHEGQYVFIIPDKRMVVVRTGMTRGREAMPEVAPLLRQLYEAVGAPGDAGAM